MFFDTWFGLLRVIVVGTLAYGGLVLLLRLSGKRTLSKMNAFDLVVTVALGSTLATTLLTKDIALVEGMLAFALLIALQFVIAWSSVRWRWVSRLVKSDPTLLFHKGEYLEEALRKERVTREEVRSAMRSQGVRSPDEALAVILETDGSFNVLRRTAETKTDGSYAPILEDTVNPPS